jgi:hypothetical protein
LTLLPPFEAQILRIPTKSSGLSGVISPLRDGATGEALQAIVDLDVDCHSPSSPAWLRAGLKMGHLPEPPELRLAQVGAQMQYGG